MALWHLWLCPWDLLLSWSQLWEWCQMSSLMLVVDWLSLSIHSSSVAAATSACWWASLTLVSSHSPNMSCLSLWEALSQLWDGQVLVGSVPLLLPLLCLRWSFKEDKISLITPSAHSGPHGGPPHNLLSMYT